MTKIKIKSITSKDTFVLFCALNAFGYDDENNKRGMHPIRRLARKNLSKLYLKNEFLKLNNIFRNHHHSGLLIELLKRPLKSLNQHIRRNSFSTFYLLNLKTFSKAKVLDGLWRKYKKIQLKENKKHLPLLRKNFLNLSVFLNKLPKDISEIILIVNPLDAYWRGYGFKIKKVAYIVVGPGAEKNDGELMRHELLHILAPNFHLPQKIYPQIKSLVNAGYNNKKIIGREYVVRGLNLLYEEKILKNKLSKIIKIEQRDFPEIKKVLHILEKELKKEKG